ncbi:MAG TPA: DUF1328 domain-containing protein [Rhizobiales bacterium]|nr:DUF1328 domain-containing protein [Hyphomicrobiales bacterium]HAN62804.1 DUF1328 domain-containing protein [Hyphomicrobiales bacterium]
MLNRAVAFLIIAVIAGALELGVLGGVSAAIANILFVIFLVFLTHFTDRAVR